MPPKKKTPNGRDAFTVDEQLRIMFTRQLQKLRDDLEDEVVFPSTLTNIERKFLHKVAEELGLSSKSTGIGENRKITVTKKTAKREAYSSDIDIPMLSVQSRTFDTLRRFLTPIDTSGFSSIQCLDTSKHECSDSHRLADELPKIRDAYNRAQAQRSKTAEFQNIQTKRSLLPASQYNSVVCQLVKENQIVLVRYQIQIRNKIANSVTKFSYPYLLFRTSGETGCGKSK